MNMNPLQIGFKEVAKRFREKAIMSIAWSMPKTIVYWCAIRLMAHATVGKYGNQVVPELKAMDALERWKTA